MPPAQQWKIKLLKLRQAQGVKRVERQARVHSHRRSTRVDAQFDSVTNILWNCLVQHELGRVRRVGEGLPYLINQC